MIVFVPALAAALVITQPVVAPPAPPAPPTAAAVAPVDPARIAAAQRFLDATHIEQQYDGIFSKMIPVMSVQIMTGLKDNVKVPAGLRTYLADSANEAKATQIFASEATKGFKARYPRMRDATAREYARLFSADELTALTAFYTTPLGQKALTSLPEIQAKLMPIGMAAGGEVGREAMMRMLATLGLDDAPAPKS